MRLLQSAPVLYSTGPKPPNYHVPARMNRKLRRPKTNQTAAALRSASAAAPTSSVGGPRLRDPHGGPTNSGGKAAAAPSVLRWLRVVRLGLGERGEKESWAERERERRAYLQFCGAAAMWQFLFGAHCGNFVDMPH